jgi:hypothetical protein
VCSISYRVPPHALCPQKYLKLSVAVGSARLDSTICTSSLPCLQTVFYIVDLLAISESTSHRFAPFKYAPPPIRFSFGAVRGTSADRRIRVTVRSAQKSLSGRIYLTYCKSAHAAGCPTALSYSHGSTVYHYVCPFTRFPITLIARPPCHRRAVVVILPLLSCRLGFPSVQAGIVIAAMRSTVQYSTVQLQFSLPQWFQIGRRRG